MTLYRFNKHHSLKHIFRIGDGHTYTCRSYQNIYNQGERESNIISSNQQLLTCNKNKAIECIQIEWLLKNLNPSKLR